MNFSGIIQLLHVAVSLVSDLTAHLPKDYLERSRRSPGKMQQDAQNRHVKFSFAEVEA